ncbi:MAG: chemotaxis response regulator protein-glutamate methylesterase [Bryobacteraceae bacterium]
MTHKKILAPGAKIRVLVVDDSVVIRRLVASALEQDPDLEVVGTAANGNLALQRIAQLAPDVVTLDIEMPEMDGLATVRELRRSNRDVRVIMFSTLTQRGASATMDALSHGADDYVTKAANVGSLDRSRESLRTELIPKVKQFFHLSASKPQPGPSAAPAPSPITQRAIPIPKVAAPAVRPRPRALVIGVSTGGPVALQHVVPRLPREFPVPVLIVQHMPPMFTRLLAERLQKDSPLQVREAQAGDTVTPGHVWIAPGNYHMRLKQSGQQVVISLDQGPQENSCRPAVDVLFRSAAEVYGGAVVASILTGMGEDGARGVAALRPLGAYVIVQDEPTSVVWGMPGAVANAGLADEILPLDAVAPRIIEKFR